MLQAQDTHPINLNLRKHIDWIIKSYESHPTEFFLLLKILSSEWHHFFNNEQIRTTLFYVRLRDNLLAALIKTLDSIKSLNPEQFKYCLIVLVKINENTFLDNINKYIKECDSTEKILTVIYILLSIDTREYLSTFISDILLAMRPHTNNVIVKDIIDKLIEYSDRD